MDSHSDGEKLLTHSSKRELLLIIETHIKTLHNMKKELGYFYYFIEQAEITEDIEIKDTL